MEMVHCIMSHGKLSKEIQGARGSRDFCLQLDQPSNARYDDLGSFTLTLIKPRKMSDLIQTF